jgi:hypothetical protein
MKNTTFGIIAIAAVTALLIATTTTLLLTNDASAKKKSFHETAAQSCVNQNARCQDLLSQIQGHDNSANVIGNQPTAAAAPTPIPTPITPPPEPEPQPAKLIVTKVVICPANFVCPKPSDFTMKVTGNNADPATFPGSSSGTSVSLSAGPYSVDETAPTSFLTLTKTFGADCSGSINAGETKNCKITNSYSINGIG